MINITEEDKERFLKPIKYDDNGCWIRGKKNRYGSLTISGRVIPAHRFSWMLAFGEIEKGLFVCHHCDNPPCVNPDHLFLGTCGDNTRDWQKKYRAGKLEKKETTRMLIKLNDDLLKKIENWRGKHRPIPSRRKAVIMIIEKFLDLYEATTMREMLKD